MKKLSISFLIYLQLSDGMGGDDSLDLPPLTDLVGNECLAGIVPNPSIAQPVKNVPTSVTTTSTSSEASEMPSDISDLQSLNPSIPSLSGVDIDNIFAGLLAEQREKEVKLCYFSGEKNWILIVCT